MAWPSEPAESSGVALLELVRTVPGESGSVRESRSAGESGSVSFASVLDGDSAACCARVKGAIVPNRESARMTERLTCRVCEEITECALAKRTPRLPGPQMH